MDFVSQDPAFNIEASDFTQFVLSVSPTQSDGLRIEAQDSLRSDTFEDNSTTTSRPLVW